MTCCFSYFSLDLGFQTGRAINRLVYVSISFIPINCNVQINVQNQGQSSKYMIAFFFI